MENWQKVKTFERNVVLYNTHSEDINFFVCSSCLTTANLNLIINLFFILTSERILGSLKKNFNIHNIRNIFNIPNKIQNNELKGCKVCKQLNSNENVIRDNLAMQPNHLKIIGKHSSCLNVSQYGGYDGAVTLKM